MLLLLLLACQASDPDVEIRKVLKARALELEQEFRPGRTSKPFEDMRSTLHQQYLQMLGLQPLPERTPLNATITGRLDFPDFSVEKLHYQSRPGLYVTGNLYLPKAPGPHPAILYACGHSNMKRDGNKTAYQDHGIWFATHGYVCLVIDTLQLGEIGAIHHGTYREQRWWWHSLGYTSAGVECWNGMRGLDYLESRPEVDRERLGATGISGGGAATFWLAAADPRVKVAVPVSGMADLGYYVGEDGVNGHCDCMFLYNQHRWNWTDIAALVAPRPLLFANSDKDPIFPMSANERIINRLETLYAQFGASDKVDALVSIGGHAYRGDLRRGIFEWFNRHLKTDARPVSDADAGLARRIEPKDLRVFPEDKDLPADQRNTKIDEGFITVSRPVLPAASEFKDWQARLKRKLKDSLLSTLSEGSPSRAETLFVLRAGETPAAPEWAQEFLGAGRVDYASDARTWTRKNPPNTVERSLVLLGETRDSLRTGSLHMAMKGGVRRVVGRGIEGILGAYAALYTDSVQEVILADPPVSHLQGPHYLAVLQTLDIPDALGLLAPRKLVLINAKDPAFDRTVEIYRLAGAADKIERR